jgi:hypothetical protein
MKSLPKRRRWLTALAFAAVVIGFLNFLWFFAESSTIGDATRGYTRDWRYSSETGTAGRARAAVFAGSSIRHVSRTYFHPE